MNLLRRITVFAVTAVSMLAFASCGETDAENILLQAQEKSESIQSMDYTMNVDMDLSSGGQTVSMAMTGDASCFSDPMKMKMTMTMDMGDLGSQDVDIYAEETDGKFVTYSGAAGSWVKQEVDSLAQYDGMSSMKVYLDNAGSLKLDGEEELASGPAHKISAVISGDSMEEVLNASGVMDSMMGQLGTEYIDMIKVMYSDMGDLPVTIWVNKENGYPVKYEMDMTEMMSQMMNKLMEQMGDAAQGVTVDVGKMVLSMEMNNINNATEFEIPQEARDAQLIGA